MKLIELTLYESPGVKTAEDNEGAKIPWDDPEFSRRMLEQHLSQAHDWASRRRPLIAGHVSWIARQLQRPSRILDLGCGPGLYLRALAEQGHACVGLDFSPASIAYARQQSANSGLDLEYILCDIRDYRSEREFDCIIMTFGEFNAFTRRDAAAILETCAAMLRRNGLFVLEAHTYEAVQAAGEAPATWQRHAVGLFSSRPHLCLRENIWDAAKACALSRYFIIDAASAKVQEYASFMQAYRPEDYTKMLLAAHLPLEQILGDETWPAGQDFRDKLRVMVCRKR